MLFHLTHRSFGMQDNALALFLHFCHFFLSFYLYLSDSLWVYVVLCVFMVLVGTDADLFLHTNRSAIIQFFNFIALSGVCMQPRSMQVSECVNRVLFQVAFRVTMHYYSQPGNKSQFHACNVVSVTSVLAIVRTKQQQQTANGVNLECSFYCKRTTTAKIKWN